MILVKNKLFDEVKCWYDNNNLLLKLNKSKYMIFDINKRINNNYYSDLSSCVHTYNYKYLKLTCNYTFRLFE